jgi:hypothetical protein
MPKDKQPFEALSETAKEVVDQNVEKLAERWITISVFFKTSGVATI